MSERSTQHATFSVERVYDASPDRTFAAWSDPVAKARWYSDPEQELELDFRVGGWERHGGALPDGREYAYQAVLHPAGLHRAGRVLRRPRGAGPARARHGQPAGSAREVAR